MPMEPVTVKVLNTVEKVLVIVVDFTVSAFELELELWPPRSDWTVLVGSTMGSDLVESAPAEVTGVDNSKTVSTIVLTGMTVIVVTPP